MGIENMIHQLEQQHTIYNENELILCCIYVLMQYKMKRQEFFLSRLDFGKEKFEYDITQQHNTKAIGYYTIVTTTTKKNCYQQEL